MSGRAPIQPRISYLIGRLHRTLRKTLDESIREHGLTVAQYAALSILAEQPGLSNAQLARRSFMSAQSANQTLHALHEAGFVRRKPDPDHGRISSTELTSRGQAVLNACERVVDTTERAMLAQLGADQRKRLLASLKTCLRTIDASYHG
jgi:DNA-binding MarR family transcriptional regulator